MGKRRREDLERAYTHKRPAQTTSSSTQTDEKLALLDSKYPSQSSYAHLAPYNTAKTVSMSANSSALPPLPPISKALSEAPFTHSSSVDGKYGVTSILTYERLEFLGDAYLEIIATRLIYSRFPFLLTGKQAKLRENLVRNSTLARFAQSYGFGKKVRLDKGASDRFGLENGGLSREPSTETGYSAWEKILADVFEAYVAAAVLSDEKKGFEVVEEWMTNLWMDILLKTDEDETMRMVQNRKEELARLIGGKEVKIEYLDEKAMEMTWDRSRQQHHIAVYLTGWGYEKRRLGGGSGVGKKEAGMRAAADALDNNKEFVEAVAETKQKADTERRARMEKEKQKAELEAMITKF